jgi:chemotaxis protein methyltransferase CheR
MEPQRLSQRQFNRFSDFIYDKSGIRINFNKVLLLSNRIRRRLKSCERGSFDEYYRYLKSPAGVNEVEHFLDAVTTNETFFFRSEKHFHWLRNDFINGWISSHSSDRVPRPLRIWSAACSTGAEPYSIAICLAENRHRLRDFAVSILATDVSREILGIAREGKFKSRTMESVTLQQRRRYFQVLPEQDTWQIKPEIREMVEFKHHNLVKPPPALKFDCIFICNVLIYFDQDSKQRAIENLLNALNVGGYLVFGPSEGVSGMLDSLKKISPLVYQKALPNPPVSSVYRGVQP